jgi:hypothetical protein
VVARFGGDPGKRPQSHSVVVDVEQIGHSANRGAGCDCPGAPGSSTGAASIIGTIADERLRIDCQPFCPLRPQNIPRVQIGRQDYIVFRGLR